jgi:hypothetical protein
MRSLFRFLVFRLLRTHRRHYRLITASTRSLEILDISLNMPPPLLKRGDTRLAEVDRGIRNPFRWDWLDVKVNIEVRVHGVSRAETVTLGDSIEKCVETGVAFCRLCESKLKYSSSGKKSLMDHIKSKKHLDNFSVTISNQQIICTKDSLVSMPSRTTTLQDRVSNQEVSSFIYIVLNN